MVPPIDPKCLSKMENQPGPSEKNLMVTAASAERSMQEAVLEKAVAQGKFEIAADVLHDIGNAVVGFGSYLTRIKRSVEQNTPENLENLSRYFSAQQTVMAAAIGQAKAAAVVSMLEGIIASQKANHLEIGKSVAEQLHIITHIQEILSIQRQYVVGHGTLEKKPTNLRTILEDCLSMLFASIEKRGIGISMDITAKSPVILGDRTKLMQVVMNILKNSIEAIDMNTSGKTISIRLQEEDGRLVLLVRDSGNGFDKATAGLLFSRGFTTKLSGTGLGLQNCRTIIESHAGTMTITSDGPGKGALTLIHFKI
jgi:signal transduction histidine kinase